LQQVGNLLEIKCVLDNKVYQIKDYFKWE